MPSQGFCAGAAETQTFAAEAAAQRTKELLDHWRSLSAQQQCKCSLDDGELLQHQMSRLREGFGVMRFTSLEYGR